MKQFLIPLALTTVFGLSQCKKDDPQASLPDETQVGANTGGCLINGQAFIATGWGGSLLTNPIKPVLGGFAFDSTFYLRLYGQLNGANTTVTLFLRSHRAKVYPMAGTYLLDKTTQYYPQQVAQYTLNHATYTTADNSNEVYVTDARHTGQVILTRADTLRNVSSGTFQFTAASQLDPTKTVTITSGRFDRQQ
ncbi:MAG: DUF6252 family protein [Janthinobacterium lividum]